MIVAVIGSRCMDETYYPFLCEHMPRGTSQVASGGAMGADALGKRYAEENGLLYTEFAPDYAKYGRRAPLVRNEELVRYADYVIALWDGPLAGTAHAINACIKEYTPVRVYLFRDSAEPLPDIEIKGANLSENKETHLL